MTGLLELADRCEKAAGPDRELDRDMATALISYPPPKWMNGKHVRRKNAKHYTASLDAAMTLVPDGWSWTVAAFGADSYAAAGSPEENIQRSDYPDVRGATPALAVCAAALRARATLAKVR